MNSFKQMTFFANNDSVSAVKTKMIEHTESWNGLIVYTAHNHTVRGY